MAFKGSKYLSESIWYAPKRRQSATFYILPIILDKDQRKNIVGVIQA